MKHKYTLSEKKGRERIKRHTLKYVGDIEYIRDEAYKTGNLPLMFETSRLLLEHAIGKPRERKEIELESLTQIRVIIEELPSGGEILKLAQASEVIAIEEEL